MRVVQFVALTVVAILLFTVSVFPQFGALGTPPDQGTGGQGGWSGWIATAQCRSSDPLMMLSYDTQGRLSNCFDLEVVGTVFPGGVNIDPSALYGVYNYPLSDGSVSYSRGVGSYTSGIWAGLGCNLPDTLEDQVFFYYQVGPYPDDSAVGYHYDAGMAVELSCEGPSCVWGESQGLYSIAGFTPVPPFQYGDPSC